MTKNFEYMLYMFGEASTGFTANITYEEADIDEIRKYSIEQGIWSLVYPILNKKMDGSKYKNEFLYTIAMSSTRKDFTLDIIGKMKENGIECCVLKGESVAVLYNYPEYRISSDADILISPKYEKKISEFLRSNGYEVETRNKNDHHFKAVHPIGGLLEVHVRLYSYITEKMMFNNKNLYNEPYTTLDVGGHSINVLGINDGLFYLTAHYIKHFIKGGGGVRQMMDLLLYMKRYENEIDFDNYEAVLKELKYYKLIEIVRSIGAKYFGMDFKLCNEDLMARLLDDTQFGGLFGNSDAERMTFFKSYFKKRSDTSTLSLKLFLWKHGEKSLWQKIFISKDDLIAEGYSYAKHTVLIPFAQFSRILSIKKKKKTLNRQNTEQSNSGNQRMKLIYDLDMIE